MALIFAASFAITLLAYSYFKDHNINLEEFYILLLIATLGTAVLVASNHFVSLFLGLEILSVSLYSMIGYLRFREQNIEAGVKYLILAAVSSAFLLFGMALVYADLGTFVFSKLASKLALIGRENILAFAGFAMMIVGIGFKLAVVPFHMWTPDVYEGAPAPVTAFLATVSKGGMFAILLRFFWEVDGYRHAPLLLIFSIIAIASMFLGNLLALMQSNVKRILAYSSIAHLGYLLVAFLAGGEMAVESVTYYLIAYFVTTLGGFGIVSVLSGKEREAEELEDYRGLFWQRPWLAAMFTAMLLSLAGIPLTAGFVGKFYVLAAGVDAALWLLVIILVINSAIGLYYYLRIVVAMYSQPAVEAEMPASPLSPSLSLGGGVVLSVLTLLLIWFGVYPATLMEMIAAMVTSLNL